MANDNFQNAIQAQIEWCTSQRDRAVEMIEEIDSGVKWFRATGDSPPQDVSDKWREQRKRTIKSMEKLIASYEKLLEAEF